MPVGLEFFPGLHTGMTQRQFFLINYLLHTDTLRFSGNNSVSVFTDTDIFVLVQLYKTLRKGFICTEK